MNNLHICPPHLSDVATLRRQIFKKISFQHYYSYILRIIHVIPEENKLQLLYCSLAVYLLLFSASCYLHSPIAVSVARYRSACIEYQSPIRTSCVDWLE